MDRLGNDRHVAQMASLMGRDLPEPLTRDVIASILGLSDADVVGSLARLIDAEIVEPLLTELTPGYRFRHELIREALALLGGTRCNAEPRPDRRSASSRRFPNTAVERPALLAYHFARAEQHERAAAYRLSAGVACKAGAHTRRRSRPSIRASIRLPGSPNRPIGPPWQSSSCRCAPAGA